MVIRRGVKRLIAASDAVTPSHSGVTILLYHRVGGRTDSQVDLDPGVFERQLAHLVEHHRVLGLGEAIEELSSGAAHSPAVVLTFDDGSVDFCETVMPALSDTGVPATVYVTTRYVETNTPFPWGPRPVTWAGLDEAVSTGLVTVGSHSHTHALFDRMDPATIADELDRSIELIGDRLGFRPLHFAYPKAIVGSGDTDRPVRERFASAALARGKVNRAARFDPFRLWRTPIQVADGMEHFRSKAAGGMRLEGELRHHLERLRSRR